MGKKSRTQGNTLANRKGKKTLIHRVQQKNFHSESFPFKKKKQASCFGKITPLRAKNVG